MLNAPANVKAVISPTLNPAVATQHLETCRRTVDDARAQIAGNSNHTHTRGGIMLLPPTGFPLVTVSAAAKEAAMTAG